VIGKAADGELAVLMVEGKVNEPFDQTIAEWLVNASGNKRARLAGITRLLGLPNDLPPTVRYQLLHRTAAAVIEAEALNARHAVLLVHSFSAEDRWFSDYAAFAALFGVVVQPQQIVTLQQLGPITLYAGWVRGALPTGTADSC
jgi:hypothetical protein